MLKFENHIILDQKESWPAEILNLILESREFLQKFLIEEKRIDDLERIDFKIKLNRPKNIYSEIYNEVVNRIENILKTYNIIGFHCTKLMDYEIRDILENGLKPLNKNFANERIIRLYQNGIISKKLKKELIDKKELSDDNRINQVCVFHFLSSLKDENGLNKLFGLWGGEAIYSQIENPIELKKFGISCIIIGSIKIDELPNYFNLSKRMLAIYFNETCTSQDTDSYIKTKIDVLKIIRNEDEFFNILTNISNWKKNMLL